MRSCSVLLDGVLVCSCLVLAAQADGHEVMTVEGLADGEELHPVQAAFVRAGAVQCGFCTPGLVVAAADLLARSPQPSDDEIREALPATLPLHRLREDLRRGSPGRTGRLGMNRHRIDTKDTLRAHPAAGENRSGWRVVQLPTQGGEHFGVGRFGLRGNGRAGLGCSGRKAASGRPGQRLTTVAPGALAGRIAEAVPRRRDLEGQGEFAYSRTWSGVGMLWGHTVRSLHSHARIIEIDMPRRCRCRVSMPS